MKLINTFFESTKKAQTPIIAYIFYISITFSMFLALYFYLDSVDLEVESFDDYSYLKEQGNELFENINSALQYQEGQSYIYNEDYEFEIETINNWLEITTDINSVFYEFQINFCSNYSISSQDINNAIYNSSRNCINLN